MPEGVTTITDVFSQLDIGSAMGDLVSGAAGLATEAAPYVIGAVGIFAGINLGVKLFRRFTSKVG